MIPRTAVLCLALPLLACPPEAEPEPDPPPAGPAGLVRGLDLDRVALFQAVEVELLAGGTAVEPRTPIIEGRQALLQAFVAPHADWTPRPVRAELTLRREDGAETVLGSTITPEDISRPEDRDTTFEFRIDGAELVPGLSWRLELWETEPGVGSDQAEGLPTWPVEEDEVEFLPVSDWGGVVRVELIPIRYDADGSGRLPDTSAEQVAIHQSWIERLFPVHTVEVRVAPEFPTDIEMTPDGEGWGDMLEAISELRVDREIPWDTYTYGIVAPADDRAVYCRTGCTAGLSYLVSNPSSVWLRSSIGLGYSGDDDARVLVHELGHAHGRRHAPCGNVGNPDGAYPYDNGAIGVWGWDSRDDLLIPPFVGTDVMGYCGDKWISDYQFSRVFSRVAMFEGLLAGHGARGVETPVVVLRIDGLGNASLRGSRVLPGEPEGEQVRLRYLAEDGRSLEETDGALALFGDHPGGTLFAPEPPEAARFIEVDGGEPVSLEGLR